jgi:hypothetical protein
MGRAGTIKVVEFETCGCGYPGFRSKGDAIRFRLNRQAYGATCDEPVECPHPRGKFWHVNDRSYKSLENYVAMLAAGKVEPSCRQRPIVVPAPTATAPEREQAEPRVADAPPSSPRVLPQACPTGKVGYASERRAQASLEEAQRLEQGVVKAYRCNDCGRWHLTSTTFAPNEIQDHEELVADGLAMFSAKYPDGRLVSVTLRNERAYVRIPAKLLPAVRALIGELLDETNEARREGEGK